MTSSRNYDRIAQRLVRSTRRKGWCRDVTDEIAAEVRGLCAGEVSPSLAAFLEAH